MKLPNYFSVAIYEHNYKQVEQFLLDNDYYWYGTKKERFDITKSSLFNNFSCSYIIMKKELSWLPYISMNSYSGDYLLRKLKFLKLI